jgi:hypothetical protein
MTRSFILEVLSMALSEGKINSIPLIVACDYVPIHRKFTCEIASI